MERIGPKLEFAKNPSSATLGRDFAFELRNEDRCAVATPTIQEASASEAAHRWHRGKQIPEALASAKERR